MLKYYKCRESAIDPKYATEQSACFDISACIDNCAIVSYSDDNYMVTKHCHSDFVLKPFHRALIPTGLIFDLSSLQSLRIHPRSGLAIKNGITLVNCEGVIDADYVQETFITLVNYSNTEALIKHGDRLAQAEIVEHNQIILQTTLTKPEQKTSRSGGFGSTGVNEEQAIFSFDNKRKV